MVYHLQIKEKKTYYSILDYPCRVAKYCLAVHVKSVNAII